MFNDFVIICVFQGLFDLGKKLTNYYSNKQNL